MPPRRLALPLLALTLAACARTPSPPPPLFEKLSARATGVEFANALPEK